MAACVFAGSLAIPMGFEILWRFDHVAGSHQQPEVVTVEVGGQDLVHGTDPYVVPVRLHHPVRYHPPGQPDFEGFLPVPAAHGRRRHSERDLAEQRAERRTDLLLPDDARRRRPSRCISAGPTDDERSGPFRRSSSSRVASLPLATGGDDIPVVAFLLLAIVLAQRQRPFASGVVFGIASAMKFTAWPLAALALFAARGRNGERRPFSMLAGMIVVAVPTIFPFAPARPVRAHRRRRPLPARFEQDPDDGRQRAARSRAGERVPVASRALPLAVGIVLAVLLARHLYRHTPGTAAEVCMIAGVVMSALILLAPDPRVGYLLYPINFFVWAYLLAQPAPRRRRLPLETADASIGSASN